MFKDFNTSSKIWCFWLNNLCTMASNIIEQVGKEKVLEFISNYEKKYEHPIHPTNSR